MPKLVLKILILSACAWFVPAIGQEEPPRAVNGVLSNGSLVVLREDGSITAWSMPSGERNTQLSAALGSQRFLRIASSNDGLWGANGDAIFQWRPEGQQWVEVAPQLGDELQALVAVEGDLMQVYERVVYGTVSDRQFMVPSLGGQLDVDYLRILAIYAQGETLWIGTGQGEWGGHLVALNTQTGRWKSYYDPLNYVTGITRYANNSVYASWSMSHFSARTLIRVHATSTEPVIEFEELDERYYQHISSSPFERKLYGVEQNSLVEIDDGVPREISNLGQLGYGIEPNAVGVAPAIVALIPVDSESVVIVHERSSPKLFQRGQLRSLEW